LYAKNLEHALLEACRQSDVSTTGEGDMAQRFEALRAYGLLPRGREKRATLLNPVQIAGAIAGLVPVNPKWAGHGALILLDLRPVGGPTAAPGVSGSLSDAIVLLLSQPSARKELLFLTLSLAESGTNAHGIAKLVWRDGALRREAAFVSKMAVSQLQPGAEQNFDFDYFHARAARMFTLNARFFDYLARAIDRTAPVSFPISGDGSEYDAEEARQARFDALGVTRNSRFLNMGVDTQATWPQKETLIPFDQYRLVLMPETAENARSIHIDLHSNKVSDEAALTIINRFLSLLAWCDDQFAVAQEGWSGNPVPVAVPRRDLAFVSSSYWHFDRKIPATDEARKALALFREGRNAEEAGLASYAVLSYFKIIETRHDDGEKARKWIGRAYPLVTTEHNDDLQLQDFVRSCGQETPENYIYKACRHAVAHASTKHPTDADEFSEVRRLYSAAHVLRLLARHFIAIELKVPTSFNEERKERDNG
jgi:hypothetical protein